MSPNVNEDVHVLVSDSIRVPRVRPDGETDTSWAQVMVGDSALMFQERESLAEKLPVLAGATIGGSVPLYVNADDAENLYADLDAATYTYTNGVGRYLFGYATYKIVNSNDYAPG